MDLPDYIQRNRSAWNDSAGDYVAAGERNWASEPSWGVWDMAETELGLLPDIDSKDALEDGCGTAYVSAWPAIRRDLEGPQTDVIIPISSVGSRMDTDARARRPPRGTPHEPVP